MRRGRARGEEKEEQKRKDKDEQEEQQALRRHHFLSSELPRLPFKELRDKSCFFPFSFTLPSFISILCRTCGSSWRRSLSAPAAESGIFLHLVLVVPPPPAPPSTSTAFCFLSRPCVRPLHYRTHFEGTVFVRVCVCVVSLSFFAFSKEATHSLHRASV